MQWTESISDVILLKHNDISHVQEVTQYFLADLNKDSTIVIVSFCPTTKLSSPSPPKTLSVTSQATKLDSNTLPAEGFLAFWLFSAGLLWAEC